MDNDSMDLKRLRYLMRYSAAVDGMDEDIQANYGSVKNPIDKWVPWGQWQPAGNLHNARSGRFI